jgi:carbon storage regulator
MLVLSRKRGERIFIGNEVTIDVLEVRGNRVKLGIAAPAQVPVHREELQHKMEGCMPTLTQVSVCGPIDG